MPIIDIHGKQVHIEGDSNSARHAADYLMKNPDNAKSLFQAAHSTHDGIAHYVIPNSHTSQDAGISHHVTMIHNGDGTYTLQKRHGY